MSDTEVNDDVSTRRAKIVTAVWLVVSQLLGLFPIYALTIGVTFFSAVFGCGECIEGGLEHTLGSYPKVGFVCVVGSWMLFAYRKFALASLVTALPLFLSPFWLGAPWK
jgi:hypothetical protein